MFYFVALVGVLLAVAALVGTMASSAATGKADLAADPASSASTGKAGFPASLASSAQGPTASSAQAPIGGSANCASIDRYHLEKQMNHRAAAILAACGRARATSMSFSALDELTPSSPHVYGGPDKNLIAGFLQTFPNVTQSEVQVWANGNTVMAAYNDSTGRNASPVCIRGQLRARPTGARRGRTRTPSAALRAGGRTPGDPTIVYDAMHSVWVAVFLAGGGTPSCGGQGLGVWRSTDDGATWTIGNCAHVGNSDDRESMCGRQQPGESLLRPDLRDMERLRRGVRASTPCSPPTGA